MNSILDRYTDKGSFRFKPDDDLSIVCNAPKNKSGVYIVYDISNDKLPIYIGSSGHITNEGMMHVRKTGSGGIWGRVVNGHQFNREKRQYSWPKQMVKEGIICLVIQWVVTHNDNFIHNPSFVEYNLLQQYYNSHGRLPRWNRKF